MQFEYTCTEARPGSGTYLFFLGLNLAQGVPDAAYTVMEGIFADLKSMALHPLGNFSSHVTKKYLQLKQLILSFS